MKKAVQFIIFVGLLMLLVIGGHVLTPYVEAQYSTESSFVDVLETKGDEQTDGLGYCNGNFGTWSGYSYCYSGTCMAYFSPNRIGYHCLEVQGTNGNWGTVKLSWRDGGGSWHYFSTVNVDSTKRTATLYSGSTSINYRFEFIQGVGAGDGKFRTFVD